jgi:hypothetical protein
VNTSSPASPPGTVGYAVLRYSASTAAKSAAPRGSAIAVSCAASSALRITLSPLLLFSFSFSFSSPFLLTFPMGILTKRDLGQI